MKIGIDLQILSREEKTGMGRYIEELLPRLKEFKEFEWISFKPKPIKGYRTIWTHTVLPFSAIIKNINLLFCPANLIPIYVPKKIKILVTVHDIRPKIFPEAYSDKVRRYYEFEYSFLFKRADRIITVSQYSKSEIEKFFPEAKGKINVIYNGIDHSKFRYLNLPRKKQILFIGAIAKHKNIGNAIKAFSKIYKEIQHKLIIVGSRDKGLPYDEEINEILKKIPEDRIEFTGKISDEEIVKLYNESELFIFPSLHEGFGLPPLEAMACGCPVLASNSSSIPEICIDAAMYFNPLDIEDIANKLIKATSNTSLLEELRQKGIERAKKFNWETTAKETIKVIKQLLDE
ncbi:MAG: glycosyltransferase family 4 protein [Brevinematia bacterium]